MFWDFVEDEIDETGFEEVDDEDTIFQKQLIQAEMDEVDAIIGTASRIQDELHLITGPLGTVYGAYETIIEEMCTYGAKKIKPKYVVSTVYSANNE